MPKPKGSPKSGGRTKGTPNKVTKGVREAWDEAIAVAQGKKGYSLKDWATSSPEANEKFWLATIKLAPKEINLAAVVSISAELDAARKRALDRRET